MTFKKLIKSINPLTKNLTRRDVARARKIC